MKKKSSTKPVYTVPAFVDGIAWSDLDLVRQRDFWQNEAFYHKSQNKMQSSVAFETIRELNKEIKVLKATNHSNELFENAAFKAKDRYQAEIKEHVEARRLMLAVNKELVEMNKDLEQENERLNQLVSELREAIVVLASM